MKDFDLYEFAGVLVPGIIGTLGILVMSETFQGLLSRLSAATPQTGAEGAGFLSVGDLGLLVIASYIAGHLIQAFAIWIEKFYWPRVGGRPTDRIRLDHQQYLTAKQIELLKARLQSRLGVPTFNRLSDIAISDWKAIVRQVIVAVEAAGRSRRVDIFSAYHQMFRGMTVAFLLIILYTVSTFFEAKPQAPPALAVWQQTATAGLIAGEMPASESTTVGDRETPDRQPVDYRLRAILTLGVASLLARYRLHSFGNYYARELFLQFIELEADPKAT